MMSVVTDYILNIPEDSSIDTMSDELKAKIQSLGAEWPSATAINTKAVAGRKLVHVRMAEQLSVAELDNLFTLHNLDWQVLGIRSAYPIVQQVTIVEGEEITTYDYLITHWAGKAAILPFMNDIIDGVDADDNAIMRPPTLADMLYLPVYGGTDPVELLPE